MSGSWVLLFLIFVTSLPVIAVYIWFRAAKYQFSLVRFLFALLAGATAFFPALLMQELLTFPNLTPGRAALFFEIFVRVAFSEELNRLLMLLLFFWINGLIKPEESLGQPLNINAVKKGTATGLVAGLGFAILESARYAASNMDFSLVLLRVFTAALHAACGSRIGAAVVMFRANPIQSLFRVITATAIHGVFNFLVIMPGFLSLAAFFIAFSALTTAILSIRRGWEPDTAPERRG